MIHKLYMKFTTTQQPLKKENEAYLNGKIGGDGHILNTDKGSSQWWRRRRTTNKKTKA